ncbi:MAG TPA: BatA and WFA domain-containing protein [Vicinamibacterales bacterium]|nr:BatA and WFA domain-containing protein [Vicinamibacterales bacterium]
MNFLTPLYLTGAALIALPIVLHLLRRDVAPPVPFTAVRLLRRSTVERSRRHRLRDLILLAARVCALLLLAGSFARPYLTRAGASGRATVIAIDRSNSMTAPGRFERARALARDAIDEARGDRVSLVAFDERAEVIAAPGSAAEARAALAALAPGFGATRYAAAFDKAAELLADERAARVVIVTDLQRSGFDGAGAMLPEDIDVIVRDAGAAAANLSVTGAAIDRRRVTATVRNFGSSARTTEVRAVADERPLAVQRVTVASGDAVNVAFDAPSDVHRVKVVLDDPDGSAADNERFAVAEPRTLPRVLILGGGPAPTNGFYLSRALAVDGEDGADFDIRTLSGAAFAAMPAAQVREAAVVAVLSTHGLDRRAGQTLRLFLEQGGGVFVAAASDVDPSVLSTLLDWQPALDPLEIPNAGVLAATDLRHPVLRPFDAVAANFGQVTFDRVWRIEPGTVWRVVARFTGGAPALIERRTDSRKGTGTGRLLLFASDVDRRWNDFPLHPSFVPFVQEIARYLGARPPAVSSYLVGDVPAGVPARPGIARIAARTVAVNIDAREGRIDRVTPAEFQTLVVRSANASRPREQRLAGQTEAHQNYWRYGLMLMLAALVVEALVGSR